jgi:hypothetical protein
VRLRVADVLRAGAEQYESSRSVPTVVHRAVRAILACRTAALGGHAGLCESGHLSHWYNACRHRFCPRCAYYRVQLWLERQARILLGCAHHHLIFTVPHELNPLWQLNQAVLGELLFASARDALFTLAADPRYLGARPGALMALHTWGQQLSVHPHIHCLATAGGADAAGEWRACRRKHFLPAEPLKRLFRGSFLEGLRRLARRGELRLPKGWDHSAVDRLGLELRHKRWNVHVRERYGNPTAVLNYLGRYLHGGPFGERRLVAFDGERVSFRYKDYRVGQQKVMALPTQEFIRRYLQHVPPKRFHMVRGFGLYRRGSHNNHLRERAAQAVPLAAQVRAELTSDPPPRWRPTADYTPCATCGAPVRRVTQLRPLITRPRPGPFLAVA